jgi:GNAT superfamily N-acetyltransferase
MQLPGLPYAFYWLTPDRWQDLEQLFGSRGAYGGCWCMFFRLKQSEFSSRCGEGNRAALQSIVQAGERPGILAYVYEKPVGWCALAPRADYVRLARSRVMAPVDDLPVWSITCFYVGKGYRRQGVTLALLQAAIEMARERGAVALEGYPVDPRRGQTADIYAYTGLASAFRKAGFVEVARRSETRPVMRYRY